MIRPVVRHKTSSLSIIALIALGIGTNAAVGAFAGFAVPASQELFIVAEAAKTLGAGLVSPTGSSNGARYGQGRLMNFAVRHSF